MRFPERASEQRLRVIIVLIAQMFTSTWLLWQWDVLERNYEILSAAPFGDLILTLNGLSVALVALGFVGALLVGRMYGWGLGRFSAAVDRLIPADDAARRRVERIAWVPVDILLVLLPLLVVNFFGLLPGIGTAAVMSDDEMRQAYSGSLTLLAVIILAGARLSPRNAFVYLLVIHVARLAGMLVVNADLWRDALVITAQSLVYAGLLASVCVNSLRASQKLDLQFARTTQEAVEASEEAVRLAEAARADSLVHEKVLAALHVTAQAPDATTWEAARVRAVDALEALDEIALPSHDPTAPTGHAEPRMPTVREAVDHAYGGVTDSHLAKENLQVATVAGVIIMIAQVSLLVLTWDLFHLPWLSLLVYLPVAALILTYSRTDPHGPHYDPRINWRFLTIAVAPPVALAVGLALVIEPAEFVAEVESWQITGTLVSAMMLGMLLQSRLAWISAALGIAVLMVWGAVSGQSGGLFSGGWPVLALGVSTTELLSHWSRRQVERGAEANALRRDALLAEARQRTVLDARRAHSRYVDDIVRPFLEQQVTGFPFTPATSARAAQLEARLRDDLRARCFRGTDIARAATDARSRGVVVDLLDDGALDAAPAALRDRVVATALRSLDAAMDGTIVVRVLPPDREAAATVLISPLDEPPRLTEILHDGTVVYDGIPVRATREVTR